VSGATLPGWLPLVLHIVLVGVVLAVLFHAVAATFYFALRGTDHRHPDEPFAALVLPPALGVLLGGLTGVVVCCHLEHAAADLQQHPLHLALSLAAVCILARALWKTAAHVWRARRLEAQVGQLGKPPAVRTADLMARMEYSVPLVELDGRMPSLSLGRLRPWVAVSRRLATDASEQELEAVLWHEASHAHCRDNLKGVACVFAVALLCELPSACSLFQRWREACELRSDDAAVERTRSSLDLAAALVKEARVRQEPTPAAAPFAATGVKGRIQRLLGNTPPLPRRALGLLLGLLVLSAAVGVGVLRSRDLIFSPACVASRPGMHASAGCTRDTSSGCTCDTDTGPH